MNTIRVIPVGWRRGEAIEVRRGRFKSSDPNVQICRPHLARSYGTEALTHEFDCLADFLEWAAWWFSADFGP